MESAQTHLKRSSKSKSFPNKPVHKSTGLFEVDINPHMLRHVLGRDMVENRANEHNISDVLGHPRLDSSKIYTMLFSTAVAQQFYRFRGNGEVVKTQAQ